MSKNILAEGSFIGHVGGADLVVIDSSEDIEPVCSRIIELFDKQISKYYSPDDRKNNYIIAKDRVGNIQTFPLMRLSIRAILK